MAQTDVLLTKQPAPQTVPACELPRKLYDVARNTGAYTSSGLATAGFRTAKYLVDEWFQNCYARYHQAFADRDQSERQRHESRQLAAETEALAQRTQEDSTKKVGQRLQDTHCWKSELQREVHDLVAETDLLLAQKQRLERALDATAVPFSIATDNLQCRQRRQHPDLVRDHVEVELLKVRRPTPTPRTADPTLTCPRGFTREPTTPEDEDLAPVHRVAAHRPREPTPCAHTQMERTPLHTNAHMEHTPHTRGAHASAYKHTHGPHTHMEHTHAHMEHTPLHTNAHMEHTPLHTHTHGAHTCTYGAHASAHTHTQNTKPSAHRCTRGAHGSLHICTHAHAHVEHTPRPTPGTEKLALFVSRGPEALGAGAVLAVDRLRAQATQEGVSSLAPEGHPV